MNGMYWITAALYLPFIGIFFSEKGMNTMQIGILSAIMPVSALLIQPFWSRSSDKPGMRRKVLIGLNLSCALSLILFLFVETYFQIFLVTALYAVFNSAILPISDAIIVSQSTQQKLSFAKIRMCGTVSYAIVVLGAGFYLREHIQMMFLLNILSFLIFSGVILTVPSNQIKTENVVTNGSGKKGKLFQSNEIYFVLFFAFAMQFGINYYSAFLGVYLLELGYNQSLVGILNCISALSEIPILIIIHRVSKKFKEVSLLAFSVCCMAIRLILLASGNVILMAIAQLLQGPSYMISYFVCVVYINKVVAPGKISQGQGVLSFVQMGIGSLGGTLIGGALASKYGMQNGFLMVAFFLVVMSLITFGVYQWRYKDG